MPISQEHREVLKEMSQGNLEDNHGLSTVVDSLTKYDKTVTDPQIKTAIKTLIVLASYLGEVGAITSSIIEVMLTDLS